MYVKGYMCMSRAICVCQGLYVHVKGYMCMSRSICVCQGLYVYVKGCMCMSRAICVCQGLASCGIFSEDLESVEPIFIYV